MSKQNSNEEFPSKFLKKLPDGFTDSADSMKNEELKDQIVKSEGVASDIEHDMENDVKLQSLKEDLKDLSGGYRDVLSTEKAKIKYAMWLLKQRGAR